MLRHIRNRSRKKRLVWSVCVGMSRISPKLRTEGQRRRITANWAFDHSVSDKNIAPRVTSHCVPTYSRQEMASLGKPKHQMTRGSSAGDKITDGGKAHCELQSNDSSPQYIINYSRSGSTSTEDSANNDGTDSGLGSATMLMGNQEIIDYMAQNLMQFMNPTSLLPQLMKHGLITEEDATYISSSKWSDEERKERVLCALVLQESDAIDRLVKCLAEDTTQSTHRYMARRLREALEKKRQQPESLPSGTPSKSSESHSTPAQVKPRGAAQRNSIAKLLATKKNNVANLISQIETKETLQNMPKLQSHVPRELEVKQEEGNKRCMHMTNVGVMCNEKTTSNDHSLQLSGFVPPTKLPTCGTVPCRTSTAPPHHSTKPHSPHAHPDPKSPSLSSPHMQSLPLSPSLPPFHSSSTPHSYVHPATTSHIQTHHIHTSHISHSSTSTTSNMHSSRSSPYVGTPPLLHSSPSLSGGSQEDAPSNGSSESGVRRCRPVNEVVYKCTSRPHGDSDSSTGSPHVTEIAKVNPREIFNEMPPASPGIASDSNSQRNLLTHPTSPKGQKIPMLPSVKPPLPVYIPPPAYPEIPTNDLSTAPEFKEDQIESIEMTSMSPNYRTSRLTGLTARFYKHRRSTSLSSYDTRAFMRGRHPTESLDGVKKERSPFHSRSHSKAEPAQVRASLREGTEKLVKRRIEWLQERVHFSDCPEHIQFTSQTHYGEQRELLYSGTLNKHGKARFVVLFSDYLLVLKARRPNVPSKLGGVFNFQSFRIDWFSDLEYTAKKPLPLHLLTVQRQRSKQSNETFCLHLNERNKVVEIVLQAVSKEARDIWVEELSEAISLATSIHADTFVLTGNRAMHRISGEPYKKLQLRIHSASSLGLAANCNSFSLFCLIELGKQRCRTPSVVGGYDPVWDYKCEFTDFSEDDNLLIEVFSENIFRPNDFLGCVNVMLKSLPEEQAGRRVYDGNVVLAGLEEAFAGELHLTVEQGWETKM